MLRLPSINSAKVTPSASCCARSTCCATPSSSDGELRERNRLDGASLLVLHGRFDQHARHLRFVDEIERLEHHAIPDLVTERIGHFDGDLTPLEGVFVHPLGHIGGTIGVRCQQLSVHREAHGPRQRGIFGANLRDDADCARGAGAPQRGRDPDRQSAAGRRGLVRTRSPSLQDQREQIQDDHQQVTHKPRAPPGRRRSSCCTPLRGDPSSRVTDA